MTPEMVTKALLAADGIPDRAYVGIEGAIGVIFSPVRDLTVHAWHSEPVRETNHAEEVLRAAVASPVLAAALREAQEENARLRARLGAAVMFVLPGTDPQVRVNQECYGECIAYTAIRFGAKGNEWLHTDGRWRGGVRWPDARWPDLNALWAELARQGMGPGKEREE